MVTKYEKAYESKMVVDAVYSKNHVVLGDINRHAGGQILGHLFLTSPAE